MSNTAALRKATAQVEAAKQRYADANKAESADQFLDRIERENKKVEKLHPAPDELFTEMVNEVGFAAAVPQFRQEMVGRRVRDTAALDLIFGQWGAALYGGKIERLSKPAKSPTKAEALTDAQNAAQSALRAAQRAARKADLAAQVDEAAERRVLMELETPYGPLGDCTGRQGRKLQGWMGKVFTGVGDRQRLRDVKKEDDLQRIKL